MHAGLSTRALAILGAAGGAVALIIAFRGSLIAAAVVGVLVLVAALLAARASIREGGAPDPERRRVLGLLAGAGLFLVAGGTAVGRAVQKLTRPDPRPAIEAMARALGADNLDLVRRDFVPDRSGDLQLLLGPFSSSNYANESRKLAPKDPRSSHASVWMYLERVPITVYAPGVVEPGDNVDRVTLADLAPTAAHLMGFDFPAPDGKPLPGIRRPSEPPKVIVTFVIDGGGWNVLQHWDHEDSARSAWPNLKELMAAGTTYRNAIMGSFPAVTAAAHATIGTGAFPRTHGISGHNVRYQGRPVKAYGTAGRADPSFLSSPTLAERWNEHTNDGAWVGELGYQIWHLGMIGRGGARPLGDKPVAVYWDERETYQWRVQNPDLYRMPRKVPPVDVLHASFDAYKGTPDYLVDGRFNLKGPGRAPCCDPPMIRYQGDLIEATFDSEPIGQGATSLLYINFKSPDYNGHVYNFLSMRQRFALRAVDEEIVRVRRILEERFAPGEFCLIVTADHGQCPLIDDYGGVRLDPIQLEEDIDREFGRSVFKIVESVVPSEVYLSDKAMHDAGVSREDIAAYLRDYRYRDNIGPYVPDDVIEHDRLDQRIFAAVLPSTFIQALADADLSGYGRGVYERDADPSGIPPITW